MHQELGMLLTDHCQVALLGQQETVTTSTEELVTSNSMLEVNSLTASILREPQQWEILQLQREFIQTRGLCMHAHA